MRLYHVISVLFLLTAASCSRVDAPVERNVRVNIVPGIRQSEPITKEAIFPTEKNGSGDDMMPLKSTFGMFICEHHTGSYTDGSNTYTEHAERYNNIRAARSVTTEYGDSWLYNYSGYSSFPTLFLVSRLDNVTADFFAYAPFIEDITTPESVPFTIPSQKDMMYAAENSDPLLNKDINPLSYVSPGPGEVDVQLTFSHALTLLEFNFSLKYTSSQHPEESLTTTSYVLESISVEKGNVSSHLYTSGKMNALLGGSLFDLAESDEIIFPVKSLFYSGMTMGEIAPYVTLSPSHNVTVYLMLVPTQAGEDYADGDYVFTFAFSGQTFTTTFSLLRSHLLHDDGITYGFQPGYKYSLNFSVDNYLHFDGVQIGTWEVVPTPLVQTEI